MQSIPTPETLFDEAEFSAPESADFASVVDFLTGTLKEHKDVLARGQTLRVMVSEATSKEDIANLCRLFWGRGWQISYLSCSQRPHQIFVKRPNLVGMPSHGYPSIH